MMDIGKPVTELTVGIPHYYYDLLSFFGSSIYMGFWTVVLLVDVSAFSNLNVLLGQNVHLKPVTLTLGAIALIALMYIYAQTVQHWSWYVFDHWLFVWPGKDDDVECSGGKDDKVSPGDSIAQEEREETIRRMIAIVAMIVLSIVLVAFYSLYRWMGYLHDPKNLLFWVPIILVIVAIACLSIKCWTLQMIKDLRGRKQKILDERKKDTADQQKADDETNLGSEKNLEDALKKCTDKIKSWTNRHSNSKDICNWITGVLAPLLLLVLAAWCFQYALTHTALFLYAIILVLYVLLADTSVCSIRDQKKFNFELAGLKKRVKDDLAPAKNNNSIADSAPAQAAEFKAEQWQVLELVLKHNLDSGKNLIKEFARSSLAKMNAFNSMLIVIILVIRKCINSGWCLNQTILGKMFVLDGDHMFSYAVLLFTALMLMFLREYYKRNGRNNQHLCEAYRAISSDVRKANP